MTERTIRIRIAIDLGVRTCYNIIKIRHDTIMDLWKQRNYPNFKMVEFDRFKK